MKKIYSIRFQLYKVSWSCGESPTSRLTVNLDTNLRVLNPRSIAAHSSHGWGFWNHATKMNSTLGHVWSVSTPGHGGFIVVAQKKIDGPFTPALNLTCVLDSYNDWIPNWDSRFQGLAAEGRQIVEIYVYDFEEDCDWAIPVLLDASIAEQAGQEYPTIKTAEEMQNAAKACVSRWQSPEVCKFLGIELAVDNHCLTKK